MTAVASPLLWTAEEFGTPWNNYAALYNGDARTVLAGMAKESVRCVVTSPPYFHGRLYPGPDLEWGGNGVSCPNGHRQLVESKVYWAGSPSNDSTAGAFQQAGAENIARVNKGRWIRQARCLQCGMWRGQLGQEPTPKEYVAHLLEVFAQVHRVMQDDATLFLNLGDSHAGAGYSNHTGTGGVRREAGGRQQHNNIPNVRTKSLVGIPWMVAFALQEVGFLLRADIIWQKPDGMYEPVHDRPVQTYEHVFLFSKNGRYYYNPKANPAPKVTGKPDAWGLVDEIKNGGDVWRIPVQATRSSHNATMPELLAQKCILAGSRLNDVVLDPFGGAGTTACVALQNGRHAFSVELIEQYHLEAKSAITALTNPNRELDEVQRADGRAVCALCGLTYRRHPMAYEWPGYGGPEEPHPFLNRLCDGRLVKL